MQAVNGHQDGIVLKGFVGVGDYCRATRSHQSFFINGRYMKSGILSAAIEAACRERVLQGRYPSCILHLTMPYEMVDVNVHPNKLECRFQNDFALAEAVEAIIRDAFEDHSPLEKPAVLQLTNESPFANVASVAVKKQDTVAVPETASRVTQEIARTSLKSPVIKADAVPQVRSEKIAPEVAVQPAISIDQAQADQKSEPAFVQEKPARPLQSMKPLQPVNRLKPAILHEPPAAVQAFMQSYQQLPPVYDVSKPHKEDNQPAPVTQSFLPDHPKSLRMIGTAFNSYILVEYDDHLLLIDQQGVHERLLFDRMMKALDTQNCSQELLIPLIVPATRREQQLLEAHRALLQGIGLTVESFGETEVSIRSIPMILGQPQAGGLLREILDQLEGERGVISLEKRRAGILALACKKAVRSGERLNESDLRELVVRMVEKKVVPTSPRGTPLIVALSHADVDRRFRRPQ